MWHAVWDVHELPGVLLRQWLVILAEFCGPSVGNYCYCDFVEKCNVAFRALLVKPFLALANNTRSDGRTWSNFNSCDVAGAALCRTHSLLLFRARAFSHYFASEQASVL